jgi:dihydroceramide fatty acyl 2-hydroxylase
MASNEAPVRRAEALRASPRMFDSNFLDFFSRVHWSVPLIVFVPFIGFLIVHSLIHLAVWAVALLALGGFLFWTLTEYWLHRLVFHWEVDHPIGKRLHWIIHGVHHDHPNDPLRLVMPPSVSIPLAALFLYLFYDMTHYHVHHHRPKTAAGRRLREAHMRHHFQDHTTGFGVSMPLWDHVFRTVPKQRRPD